MRDNAANAKQADTARHRAAVRTAWFVGGLAVLVYAGFILMGVLGSQ